MTSGGHMIARTRLLKSGIEMPRLGLGLSRIHYLGSERKRHRLINAARDIGVTHFDVARLYGDGLAERSLGQAMGQYRASVTIATKFGLLPNKVIEAVPLCSWPLWVIRLLSRGSRLNGGPKRSWTVETLRNSLSSSLRALRTDYVDILFLHAPRADELAGRDDLVQALEMEKKLGRVRFIGISTGYIHAKAIISQFKGIFDVVQVPETEWTSEELVPDITFGALTRGPQIFGTPKLDPDLVRSRLAQALARRRNGAVLVGTTNTDHLQQLAKVAEKVT